MIGPEFPALLTAHPAPSGVSAFRAALEGVARSELGATDLVWTTSDDRCEFTLILEPEVNAAASAQMLLVAMLAIGDAIGSLAPPQIGVTYGWPDVIFLNGARVGHARIAMENVDYPEWLVIGGDLSMSPKSRCIEPGDTPEQTCFADEGCEDIRPGQLIAMAARHLLRWLDEWERNGFDDIRKQWLRRLDAHQPLAGRHKDDWHDMDAEGNAVTRTGENPTTLHLLHNLRENHAT
ncbi:biotin/lipoate--protein ligase family protein [Qingshengfaniella alkalisoli]|uniref:BPL/LPL catalytic domain-containing protein n=1 Tax=Qingshengfaniella alkalisoli TaxID=2599296 RepID=A0A5B8IVY7_9RHOB|nr:biotin/lipoate--protein ligase family protein [Qingshengfaniella alkalisoli]QDY69794.1 hypothetical protein FPZ52_09290 [Qingshengfaniella alkalisoli]